MPSLVEPVSHRRTDARHRGCVFGPHETNLGTGRGICATDTSPTTRRGPPVVPASSSPRSASVHPSDWPYERAPLAEPVRPGWAAVADACRPARHAGAGRAGPRRRPGIERLLPVGPVGPLPVADVVSREMPDGDGPDGDRRRWWRASPRRPGWRGAGPRRGGDRHRTRFPAPPVPLRPDQPARRPPTVPTGCR